MKRVLASGVFDVLHPGHLYFLTEAKKLGATLVVVVTSDGHATSSKRRPHHSAKDRLSLVEALEIVDDAFVGAEPYDLMATIKRANPDVVALGFDQAFDENKLADDLVAAGYDIPVMRLGRHPEASSTSRMLRL